jgi:glucose-6-phosphate isomerase
MLRLDYTYMTAAAMETGLTPRELEEGWRALVEARQQLEAGRKAAKLGFLDLPDRDDLLAAVMEATEKVRSRGMTDAVVLGIGGSALGTIVLLEALRNDGRRPRVHVVDNVDPAPLLALLARLVPTNTCFLVVSKSGETVETLAQYLVAREWLERSGVDPVGHLAFVTDPHRGTLRRIADGERILALPVPPNVGGRFSVLSPVGLFPAALAGLDVAALLAGARAVRDAALAAAPERDVAGAFAVLQWLAHARRGSGIHVLMPYCSALRSLGYWFVQLWAESLGKKDPTGRPVGPTPLAALGATDQHSQLQLFMDGPPDKTITFVRVLCHERDLPIPRSSQSSEGATFEGLAGRGLADLLDAEYRSTAAALAARQRLSMTFELERLDAWHVGGLLMLLQLATAYAGSLYGVDAFDQPGVELGKRFTGYLLGRPGFHDVESEWKAIPGTYDACTIAVS